MKKTILSLAVFLLLFSCSNDETTEIEQTQHQEDLLSRSEINEVINTQLESNGDFIWNDTNVNTIWSAVQLGEGILTVGYGNSSEDFLRNNQSEGVKENVLKSVYKNEGKSNFKENLIYQDEKINFFDIKVTKRSTIELLMKNSSVRYIEPSGYKYYEANNEIQQRSSEGSSGCGYNSVRLNKKDYRTIKPGSRVPWSFDIHNIPQAWDYSTGSGVTVAIVDSGLSPEQSLMNQDFNDGHSSGRFVQKYGTFVDSWLAWSNNYDGVNDKCGHGTSMASVATAPRNNNRLPVGVAYNANLVSYRAVENVVIDDYHEKRGVVEALTALANRSDVKVISMSIGSPFSIGNVSDAVKYAYSKGKMIVAAGGTSTTFTTWYGVIFPASMSETVAVTGVMENSYSTCDVCHSGSQIDFTVAMQRNSSDNTVPVLSYYDGKANYVGGSSVATATTAGIAALVWSKNPSWSREQVLNKMKQSADFYPNKHSEFGYGNIDALKAVQ